MEMDALMQWLPALCSALASLAGVIASTRLTEYRIKQLEDKVHRHNQLIERTYRMEGAVQELQHDVRDLKKYHEP